MKWEYRIEPDASNFEMLGDGGWELVAVDSGIAYFKRPSTHHYNNLVKMVIEKHFHDELRPEYNLAELKEI